MGAQGAAFYYDPTRTQDTVGGTGISNTFGNPNLREEQADTFTIGVAMDLFEDFRLTVDYWQIEIDEHDRGRKRRRDVPGLLGHRSSTRPAISTTPPVADPAESDHWRRRLRESSVHERGSVGFLGCRRAAQLVEAVENGGGLNLNTSIHVQPPGDDAGSSALAGGRRERASTCCSLQLQCLNYDYRRVHHTSATAEGCGTSMTHQYWPKLENEACRTNNVLAGVRLQHPAGLRSVLGVREHPVHGRYMVSVGIENLLDTEPPCLNANPTTTPTAALPFQFATDCTRTATVRRTIRSVGGSSSA